MRCAFVLLADQLGGHELMSLKLAEQFRSAGHESVVYYPNNLRNPQRLVDESSNINTQAYDAGISPDKPQGLFSFITRSFRSFMLIWQLKSNYDLVINCQGSFEQNWVLSLFCRILKVNMASYIPYTCYPSERKAKFSVIRDRLYACLVSFPSKYIVIHEHYKKHLTDEFNIKDSLILVVNNQVDIEIDPIQDNLYLKPKPIEFLLPGRIYFPQKGQDILIQAIKQISDLNLNAKFRFVGDGPDIDKLKNEIISNKLSEVCFISPWQSDVSNLYKTCDCVVLPSRYEGVSLVMLEAISIQKPLIASTLPINFSFINDNFLFETENALSLSNQLLQMYQLIESGNWQPKNNYFKLPVYEQKEVTLKINTWI